MEKLQIPFIEIAGIPSSNDVALCLNQLHPIEIGHNPWPQFSNSVKANYTIAHNGNAIFLKYQIEEGYVLANATTNQNVHNDSCVEFFIAFGEDENYYNLEFNCLGWSKIGYGFNRKNRYLLPSCIVETISSFTRIEAAAVNAVKLFDWEITVVIPLSVFSFHNFNSFKSLKARGNFYKCGTKMPEPHYLTWNLVKSLEPDFHRKEDFALMEFS
ncbi:carbohydrate-binding family 9-like protein [Pedobacter cryophilus]|uniref:Carbohydrate-binding domain-containing protein n=1 Tax=Pedobacter cryophilus TaxID=2571271 RepID=A0A4U1C2E6_9SPHI|nr:carbohydrate-binding family 9-like protein [Pedobacter cryophilus]TKB99204.1 hypothetical protein FA046_08855 [Pedobacter cryophilus]